MILGSAVRLVYGGMSLLAPDTLAKLAGEPLEDDPRYFNALFGGRDVTIAGATLAALSGGRDREAVLLNLSCEATDLAALVQELRARGGLDQTLVAAIGFNAYGWTTWLSALRRLG